MLLQNLPQHSQKPVVLLFASHGYPNMRRKTQRMTASHNDSSDFPGWYSGNCITFGFGFIGISHLKPFMLSFVEYKVEIIIKLFH